MKASVKPLTSKQKQPIVISLWLLRAFLDFAIAMRIIEHYPSTLLKRSGCRGNTPTSSQAMRKAHQGNWSWEKMHATDPNNFWGSVYAMEVDMSTVVDLNAFFKVLKARKQ